MIFEEDWKGSGSNISRGWERGWVCVFFRGVRLLRSAVLASCRYSYYSLLRLSPSSPKSNSTRTQTSSRCVHVTAETKTDRCTVDGIDYRPLVWPKESIVSLPDWSFFGQRYDHAIDNHTFPNFRWSSPCRQYWRWSEKSSSRVGYWT